MVTAFIRFWIPASAGMTVSEMNTGMTPYNFVLQGRHKVLGNSIWIPAFAGMTRREAGMTPYNFVLQGEREAILQAPPLKSGGAGDTAIPD